MPSRRGGQVFFLCGVVELPKTVECVANKCSPGSLPVSIACSQSRQVDRPTRLCAKTAQLAPAPPSRAMMTHRTVSGAKNARTLPWQERGVQTRVDSMNQASTRCPQTGMPSLTVCSVSPASIQTHRGLVVRMYARHTARASTSRLRQ